jgi:hypothetical protein
MAIEAKVEIKTAEDYIKEIQELLGDNPPISINMIGAQLASVSIEESWREGTTTPVETLNADGTTSIEYEEDYVEKRLTKAQTTKANAWIKENMGGS